MKKLTGAKIKAEREARGLTQQEAAEVVGVVQRTWSNYERNKCSINPKLWEYFLIKTSCKNDKL